MTKKHVALCLALALTVVLASACGGKGDPMDKSSTDVTTSTTATSQSAELLADHDAVVYTESGEKKSLSELAGGKPLVVNIWATWCPYCVDELPDFLEIYSDYKDDVAFAFVDATDEQGETIERAAAWLKDNGFEELPDYYDVDYSLARAFGINAYPTTILVNADGEIVAVSAGRIDPTSVRKALDSLA